jgi:cyclase
MKSRLSFVFVAGILALALTPRPAHAQTTPAPSPYPVVQGKVYKFEKVAEGVYYGTGGLGGNHAVIVNDNDVLLVDDGSTPATARDLLADIKLLTDKPVRTVVNSHFHFDHADGNSIFGPEVSIIGHEFVRNAILNFNVLQREPYLTSQGNRVPALVDSLKKQLAGEKDAARKADLQTQLADAQKLLGEMKEIKAVPPNVTYTTKMVLYKGSREIQILFLGRGHTGGDTVVYLPKEKIVASGDLMESQVAYMGDAYFDEWITTLGALKKLDFALDLPGHGHPFSDKEMITAFQGYLKDVTAKVADLRKQGVTPDDAAKRVDLTAYQKFFPNITGVGADLRGVRHIYEWMKAQGK